MILHPDMMKLGDLLAQQRRADDLAKARALSFASQAEAKRSNAEPDPRWVQQYGRAARMVDGG